MGTDAAVIEFRNVTRTFGGAPVVRSLSLEIRRGETFVLIGPSGCGKSTSLKMINRLVEPSEGTVLVNGRDVMAGDAAELRRGIGYVIQDAGLFAHRTVLENVATVPRLLGWSPSRIRERAFELLERVGLPPGEYADRYPRALSGGQRQRVGIARALAADPPIVLLDEPFSALDPITREHLQTEFATLSRTLGKTFVLVTHDMLEAVRLGDRIAVMRDGGLVQCATPRELVRTPADPFVKTLLGRHRYQLTLLATSIDELLPSLPPEAAGDAPSTPVPATTSVWSALEQMAAAHVASVTVTREATPARRISREQLITATSALPWT